MDNRPIAIHIGLPKCGSTYLQERYFPAHPEIDYLGPFNGHSEIDQLWKLVTSARHDEWDAAQASTLLASALKPTSDTGKIAVISRENFGINAAVGFREKAQRLHEVAPAASIIIVVREPVALIESIYLQQAKGFGIKRSFMSFSDWWEAESRLGWSSRIVSRLQYAQLANHYAHLFGEGRVRVLPFEDFARHRQTFFDSLGAFLGVGRWDGNADPKADSVANPRLSNADLFLTRFRSGPLGRAMPILRRLVPSAAKTRLRRPASVVVSSDVRSEILRFYREANEDFAARWGIDYCAPEGV